MFVPYASEIWTKSYGPNCSKFRAFWPNKQTNKKTKKFWQSVDAILEDVSMAEIIFNAKLSI